MYVGPDKTKFYVGPDKTKFYVDSDPAKFYVGPGQTNPEFNYTSVRTELNILILRRSVLSLDRRIIIRRSKFYAAKISRPQIT